MFLFQKLAGACVDKHERPERNKNTAVGGAVVQHVDKYVLLCAGIGYHLYLSRPVVILYCMLRENSTCVIIRNVGCLLTKGASSKERH